MLDMAITIGLLIFSFNSAVHVTSVVNRQHGLGTSHTQPIKRDVHGYRLTKSTKAVLVYHTTGISRQA